MFVLLLNVICSKQHKLIFCPDWHSSEVLEAVCVWYIFAILQQVHILLFRNISAAQPHSHIESS